MATGSVSLSSKDYDEATVVVYAYGLGGPDTPSRAGQTKDELDYWEVVFGTAVDQSFDASDYITFDVPRASSYGSMWVAGTLNYTHYVSQPVAYIWRANPPEGTVEESTSTPSPPPPIPGGDEEHPRSYPFTLVRTEYDWDSGTAQSVTYGFAYWSHPEIFMFDNVEVGAQWRVDWGINSLITNIDDCYALARQKKAWKTQSGVSNCQSIFNSQKQLSAAGINALISYLGGSSNYRTGDKVAASMFYNIEYLINY